MENNVRSAEIQFCIRDQKWSYDCSSDVVTEELLKLPELPDLPEFECPTTTPSIPTSAETATFNATEDIDTQTSASITISNDSSVVTGNETIQGCCGPGIYAVMIIIIFLFMILLVVIYVRYKRRCKLHAKYHTSKVEEANGTKIQNSAEAVPLKSHNWVGSSTPNSSKPNIPQSQSAEPLGQSESASMVKTPSDPQLMVDAEPQVQDLQTGPSQVELLSKDEDLV